jgi:hypothetical protein
LIFCSSYPDGTQQERENEKESDRCGGVKEGMTTQKDDKIKALEAK